MSKLSELLASIQPALSTIENELNIFEETLRAITFSSERKIDFKLNDGKKLRAALLIFCAGEANNNKDILTTAKAVELLHYASLVHDDILDQEQDRRGTAPLYSQLDFKKAILLGDYILAQALLDLPQELYAETNQALLSVISEMCIGEFIQLSMKEIELALDEYRQSYFEVNFKKTALLFGKACYIGSLFNSTLDPKSRQAILEFGENFGMAFQLLDDLNEIKQQLANPDSWRELDAAKGILTLPYIILAEKILNQTTISDFSRFKQSLKTPAKLTAINKQLEKHNIFSEVNLIIESYLQKARMALASIEIPQQEKLLLLTEYLIR